MCRLYTINEHCYICSAFISSHQQPDSCLKSRLQQGKKPHSSLTHTMLDNKPPGLSCRKCQQAQSRPAASKPKDNRVITHSKSSMRPALTPSSSLQVHPGRRSHLNRPSGPSDKRRAELEPIRGHVLPIPSWHEVRLILVGVILG